MDDPGLSNRAGHVCSTTYGGFDFAVIIWTARDLDCRSVVALDDIIDQWRVTGTAGGVDRHDRGEAAGVGVNLDGYVQRRSTIGLNYRPVESAAFKIDYQFNRGTGSAPNSADDDAFVASLTSYF